jgi:putative tryptophan/tyrosine transport system substrate-binding protein
MPQIQVFFPRTASEADMQRRNFLTLLGGAAAAWPLVARAQQPTMPVIGYLNAGSPAATADELLAFRQSLSETGYVEGRNVTIEYRWADGQIDRLPALAAELVRRQVTVIVTAGSTNSARAAIAATSTIPIVFGSANDPVAEGFVASFNRPGGNRTGVVSLTDELVPKRLEILHEVVPSVTNIALLVNPTGPNAEPLSRDLQAAARTLGLQLHVVQASTEREIDSVFASLSQMQARALMIPPNAFFLDRRAQLGALTLRHAIPAIHSYREFVAAGGLMAYGSSRTELARLVGVYTGRILKGEKAADLPVYQATKVELTINMKTAKALGITFPLTILGRADEVIE